MGISKIMNYLIKIQCILIIIHRVSGMGQVCMWGEIQGQDLLDGSMDKWQLEEGPHLVIYTNNRTLYPFYPPHLLRSDLRNFSFSVSSSSKPQIPQISLLLSTLSLSPPSLHPRSEPEERGAATRAAHAQPREQPRAAAARACALLARLRARPGRVGGARRPEEEERCGFGHDL